MLLAKVGETVYVTLMVMVMVIMAVSFGYWTRQMDISHSITSAEANQMPYLAMRTSRLRLFIYGAIITQ